MIAFLKGTLGETFENGCLLITEGGVGYEVFLPAHTRAFLPAAGATLQLYICTVVREDALELYGFATWDERQTFIILTSISKVGAKTGLAILSLFRPDDLRRIVLEDDWLMLTQVSGIGKKSGQHIFLELKYKLASGDINIASFTGTGQTSTFKDALTGLTNLGYDEQEAGRVLKEVLAEEPDLDVSGALRASLKALARLKNS